MRKEPRHMHSFSSAHHDASWRYLTTYSYSLSMKPATSLLPPTSKKIQSPLENRAFINHQKPSQLLCWPVCFNVCLLPYRPIIGVTRVSAVVGGGLKRVACVPDAPTSYMDA